MSNSAINTQVAQLKIGSVQNQADSSSVYSNGIWSFKNSTAVTSVTITDAGAVGIGTASFSSPASISPKLFVNQIIKFGSYSYIGEDLLDADSLGLVCDSTENICFGQINTGTNTLTERMRIDASGRLLVGTSSAAVGAATMSAVLDSRTANTGFGMGIIGNASNTQVMRFAYDGTAVGSITITGSATAYNQNSDYRLKEDVQPISAALSRIAALKPCVYKWKVDGSEGEGFIAHELAEVCPLAVTGEKDAVNEDGSINSQGIDPSKLVALLTAAIQELSAKVDAQAEEIKALKVQP